MAIKHIKKIVSASLLIASLISVKSGFYAKSYTVCDVDHNRVTIKDNHGYLYSFEGAEDYEVNDKVACIMFDNFTDVITDDIIVNVRYEG